MKPEALAAAAAAISAFSALVMAYIYRRQGKGFVWAKDANVKFEPLPDGRLYLAVQIPLFNLGSGTIRFKKLSAKRIHLKTGSVEPFVMEMDEAYFPPGVLVIAYITPVYDDDKAKATPGISSQIRVHRFDVSQEQFDEQKFQQEINQKLAEIGDVLFVLDCEYLDGSWFGYRTVKTTVAMELKGLDLAPLSKGRRETLNKLIR